MQPLAPLDVYGRSPEPEPEPQPKPAPRGLGYWVGQGILFPYRLAGALSLLLILLPGLWCVWRMPILADRHDVDLTLLALRAIGHERSARPFYPLGYRQLTHPRLVDLLPQRGAFNDVLEEVSLSLYRLRARAVRTARTEDGQYRHTVWYNFGSPLSMVSASPHLKVSAEELAEASRGVARLYNPSNTQEWAEVLQWSESLFWTEWLSLQEFDEVPKTMIPAPLGGTEEERLWLAWQVLRGDAPGADEELNRLPQLFARAFPMEKGQTAALEWARGLYDHMEREFTAYQEWLQTQGRPTASSGCDVLRAEEFRQFKRVLPPRTPQTYLWLLYRYVGLSEASRTAARQHWLSRFGPNAGEQVEVLGRSLEKERRAAGEPLPEVPETVPLVCVVERLTGTDAYGQRCRDILRSQFPGSGALKLRIGIECAYPNDEFFYLFSSRDPMQLAGNISGEGWQQRLHRVGARVFPAIIMAMGATALLSWVVARWLLPRSARARWQKYREGRGKDPFWLWACGVAFFAGIGCLLAPSSLPPILAIQMESYTGLFFGSLAATAFGGVLIGICRQVIAVILIAVGVDVETTWADEILGIVAGGLVLFHFGNGLVAIALYALSDLAPGLIYTCVEHARARRAHATPAAVCV